MNGYERARAAELAEGGRRAAKTLDCPRCGTPVLAGDDDDNVAARVTVDAAPLDGLVGEMLAHLDGRLTYSLEPQRGKTGKPGARVLWWRPDWQLEHGRQYRDATLHRSHRCGPPTPKGTLW